MELRTPENADTPPREWFEEHFVQDGEITYCSVCKAIPFAFIGHACMDMEARMLGIAGEQVTVPYRWEDVRPVGSEDRPGDWKLVYVGAQRDHA